MKKLILLILALQIGYCMFSQDITGQWNGVLEVQGLRLRVVFHIEQTDNGLISTMDSPDQGAKDIPVTSVSFENKVLKLAVKNAGIEYEGILNEDGTVKGDFRQGGQSFPMVLTREAIEQQKKIRPQDPIKPYPYVEEEVTFENIKAGITLAGTLTLPKKEGIFPGVVLITGSGPQNRDEELLGHRPFLVLSDYLTRNGIAVLRFDDRGTGASTGDFKTATSIDFSNDVDAAVAYLKTRKEIDEKKIGLIGHSEGGIIAPIVAVGSKDVSFIVLLAGTGIRGDQLLLLQQELIGKAMNMSESDLLKAKTINRGAFDIVLYNTDTEKMKKEMVDYFKQVIKDNPDMEKAEGMSEEDLINFQVDALINPWMRYFIRYHPGEMLEKVECPVLAINGEKDLQVPPGINLSEIQKALHKGGNMNVTIKEMPGLNHLFQECETGSPSEYAAIDQTFSPTALKVVLEWIQKQTKKL
jgi:hypothetical protein